MADAQRSSSNGPFHPGELEVQQRAGVGAMAARVGNSIHPLVPEPAAEFLAGREWVVVGTTDAAGRPWASVLAGDPGFAHVLDPGLVRLAAAPTMGDPLADHVAAGGFIGLIAPDLATRRRMRINGRLEVAADGALLVHVGQAYANCPKYIQRRRPEGAAPGHAPHEVRRGRILTVAQRRWIGAADTFFIATAHPGEGADASHRGGSPGFVRVTAGPAGERLSWPDYAGNSMFNTLGNIAAHPRAGLLFLDFETGATLQLTGRAAIDWEPAHAAAVPGAERLVSLDVESAVEIRGALPLRLALVDRSPFNPPPPLGEHTTPTADS